MEKSWYILTIRSIQANGESIVTSTIRQPYEMMPVFCSEFADVLATAAGRPPTYPMTDFSTAKVRVIPDRLLQVGPREAAKNLGMLEDLPSEEAAP